MAVAKTEDLDVKKVAQVGCAHGRGTWKLPTLQLYSLMFQDGPLPSVLYGMKIGPTSIIQEQKTEAGIDMKLKRVFL